MLRQSAEGTLAEINAVFVTSGGGNGGPPAVTRQSEVVVATG
jgi:hypothetical protein